MKQLLVDIGNSRIKWALYSGNFDQSGVFDSSPEELNSNLAAHWHDLQPASVVLCSVSTAQITSDVSDWIKQAWQCPVDLFCASKELLGVTNAYTSPEQLGADRWAALIAARKLVANAVCIVDCGTSITIDGVDASGRHIGGAILPGRDLQTGSLRQGTSLNDWSPGSHDHELNLPVKDTASAIEYGANYGIAGAIDRLILEFSKQLGDNMVVLLTGGGATEIANYLTSEFRLEKDLVLTGLALFGDQQAGVSRK
jgi:type III pantothenate kinase